MEVFNTSKKPLPLCCDTREVCHSLEEADTLSATGQRAPKPRISGSITPLWATHRHTHTSTHLSSLRCFIATKSWPGETLGTCTGKALACCRSRSPRDNLSLSACCEVPGNWRSGSGGSRRPGRPTGMRSRGGGDGGGGQ